MDGVFVLAEQPAPSVVASPPPMFKPRSVHWSGRDIYPSRLCFGRRLRGIRFVESWSESGLDYEVEVPQMSDAVVFTRFPLWVVNPLLLGVVASGFSLWRSHEKFTGAFSFPFRMRKLELFGAPPHEGSRLKCYLRLTGVTPKSHVCDIVATDGNGTAVMALSGGVLLPAGVSVPSMSRKISFCFTGHSLLSQNRCSSQRNSPASSRISPASPSFPVTRSL
jgi:hypothetical protein